MLGIQHQILPPSLNFQEPPPDSLLPGSPFHVQTAPAAWQPRGAGIPRRAAVSAFGFGGINAHLLVEEWPSSAGASAVASRQATVVVTGTDTPREDLVAVVGMEAFFGAARGLASFRETTFKGQPDFRPPSHHRWKHCDDILQHYLQRETPLPGGYLDDFQIDLADFRVPPKEIPDILPYIASYVVMALILQMTVGILAEAGLSILGLGPKTTQVPTLGLMMYWGMIYQAQILGKWWAYFPVVIVIALISFSLNLMITGLDQVFNPALRE